MLPAPPVPASQYDVIVVGAGPAGVMSSLCYTTFGLSTLHIDDRPRTTEAGRADGLQPRTLEVLRNIGSVKVQEGKSSLAKRMIAQGVRVYSVPFWDPTATEQLARTSRSPSCPDFIDVVDNYTLLLHQGLIENAFLDETELRRALLPADKFIPAPHGGVFRPYTFVDVKTDLTPGISHPVTAVIRNTETNEEFTVKAKYLMGYDGARSSVRKAISGSEATDGGEKGKITMDGDTTNIIWGVMDVEVETDFPDILSKCEPFSLASNSIIHSRDAGSIMIIPREDNLVRLYVQLKEGEAASSHVERSKVTLDICFARARKIFEPFVVNFGRVAWFSVYQIGQRIASNYTLDQRVFLGGDATHTHSPKAGQGMVSPSRALSSHDSLLDVASLTIAFCHDLQNISILDAMSLAWKVNLVETGMADPDVLLPMYESERKEIAHALLEFDTAYSHLFSGQSSPQLGPNASEMESGAPSSKLNVAVDPQLFIETFKKNAFFTSGCGAIYSANILNALDNSELVRNYPKKGVFNPAGTRLIAGQRLLPGKVTRAVDANQVRIQQEVKLNGQFRIHIFAGNLSKTMPQLQAFFEYLTTPESFLSVHQPASGTRASLYPDAPASSRHIEHQTTSVPVNPFFTFLTVAADKFATLDIDSIPLGLRRNRDLIYSDDIFDRRSPTPDNAAMHGKYGVDVEKGAIVCVRPDGYVGCVVTLGREGGEALGQYFKGFLKVQRK
ncbi:BQ2448_4587 [Microbotryum intermedium]|uniref:BQ2448_4587 protein n=1 Tax=Microbotryum intermedium TaxID=269621 RepID=A0A238FIR7_9BASI|nr:BQ2448_4587 [Microbotryum intermedium]